MNTSTISPGTVSYRKCRWRWHRGLDQLTTEIGVLCQACYLSCLDHRGDWSTINLLVIIQARKWFTNNTPSPIMQQILNFLRRVIRRFHTIVIGNRANTKSVTADHTGHLSVSRQTRNSIGTSTRTESCHVSISVCQRAVCLYRRVPETFQGDALKTL